MSDHKYGNVPNLDGMLGALPENVLKKIHYHLDHIAELFNMPRITLIVRNPLLDKGMGEGDVVITTDELGTAISALENRKHALALSAIRNFRK